MVVGICYLKSGESQGAGCGPASEPHGFVDALGRIGPEIGAICDAAEFDTRDFCCAGHCRGGHSGSGNKQGKAICIRYLVPFIKYIVYVYTYTYIHPPKKRAI